MKKSDMIAPKLFITFLPLNVAKSQCPWDKYLLVEIDVSKPVLNHNNHMADSEKEGCNLKRLVGAENRTNKDRQ